MRLTKPSLLAVCCFSLLFLFCAEQPADKTQNLIYDELIKPQRVEFYHVPIGLCEDYPEETTTMDIIRNDFELMRRTGIDLLRISFGWDAIEAEKDKYDWLFWDEFVRMAVDDYGITLIPYVCYTPMWNSTGDSLNFWNHVPIDFDEFGEFMYALVSRYQDRIKTWELWNEPDIKVYWSGTAEEWARFYKIGADAVRRADPEAVLVLGGLAHRSEWTRELFRDHGISDYCDVVNIHNYFETWSPHPVEDITDYIDEIHDIVATYGNGQSIWMAEVGYSTYRGDNGRVSDAYTAYFDYEHTPEFQAVQLWRTLALALSTEKLAAISWYEIKNLPQSEDVIGDEFNNRYLGVANDDFSPKPAQHALKFFNEFFSGDYKSINDRVNVTRRVDSHSVVECFQTRDGDVLVVAWLRTNYPGRPPDTTGLVKDTREETIQLEIPLEMTGPVTLYDELGNSKDHTDFTVGEQVTMLSDIKLVAGEIAILKVEK